LLGMRHQEGADRVFAGVRNIWYGGGSWAFCGLVVGPVVRAYTAGFWLWRRGSWGAVGFVDMKWSVVMGLSRIPRHYGVAPVRSDGAGLTLLLLTFFRFSENGISQRPQEPTIHAFSGCKTYKHACPKPDYLVFPTRVMGTRRGWRRGVAASESRRPGV
jgi:hypothetical protein